MSQRSERGRDIVDTWNEMTGDDADKTAAAEVVDLYLSMGEGEADDIRSTVIDMVCDVGHFVRESGLPFQHHLDHAARGEIADVDSIGCGPAVRGLLGHIASEHDLDVVVRAISAHMTLSTMPEYGSSSMHAPAYL